MKSRAISEHRLPRPVDSRWLARAACVALLPLAFGARAQDAASGRAYCESQQEPVRTVCLRELERSAPAAKGDASKGSTAAGSDFKVVGGTRVDANTFKGFQTWRAAACDRCHGANQEGMVGPSLIAGLKVLSKEEFVRTVSEGRLDKGMPAFKENKTVMDNMDALYTYLKGRSDGVITQAHVQRID